MTTNTSLGAGAEPATVAPHPAESPSAEGRLEARTATDGVGPLIDLTVFDVPLDAPLDGEPHRSAPSRLHPGTAVAMLAALAFVVVANRAYATLLVALAFGMMIMLHEVGHFVTARLTGMKATEFFVGFGPRIWSFRLGETEYGLKAIPLGGYVKILGMNNLDRIDDPRDEPRTFRQQSFPRRVLVASAGTLMHLLIAFVLFVVLLAGTGEFVASDAVRVANVEAAIGSTPGPAQVAGLRAGDRIAAIDGRTVRETADVMNAVSASRGAPLRFDIVRSGEHRRIVITPVIDPVRNIERIGISSTSLAVHREPIGSALAESARRVGRTAPETFAALRAFFAPSHLRKYSDSLANAGGPKAVSAKDDPNRFLSPVGAVQLIEGAGRSDIRWAIGLFASINVFVGVFNMLPVLPLDGGHVLIAFYERLRSRKGRRHRVDVAKLLPLTYAVVAVLLAIGLSSLYLDIRNPIKLF